MRLFRALSVPELCFFSNLAKKYGMSRPRKIELLAPARNAGVAIDAVNHGADAVYIGPESFGARAAAGNSVYDIARVADYAHRFDARVYATVNTIVYDSELMAVERLIHRLYRAGVDALIVQDMGLLRLDIPPIELHASTQCDIRTPEKAIFLQNAGFSQLVLPRELTLEEVARVRDAVSVPLEVFVHGALCVCYSGDCQASLLTTGRSANRGECSQVCRLPFDLADGTGVVRIRGKHLLSLRDLNLSAQLSELLQAGASSLKIEGRLKDSLYVKNVVAYYRGLLDNIIDNSNGKYARSSAGKCHTVFTPDPYRSFNRGFTTYFAKGSSGAGAMACIDTPKCTGQPVGKVLRADRRFIAARLDAELHNGDGLCFFDGDGRFTGFRLNRVEAGRLFPATMVEPPVGAVLYRNSDKAFDDELARDTSTRTIPLDFILRPLAWGVALDVADVQRGVSATATIETDNLPVSRSPQTETRRNILGRMGGSCYELNNFKDNLGNVFLAASQLASLRRKAVEALEVAAQSSRRRPLRRAEQPDAALGHKNMTRHANIANAAARQFYADHGAANIEPAAEVKKPLEKAPVVMTTRYCLRRELGACLRTPQGRRYKAPLWLVHGSRRFMLDFDCKECRMHVIAVK